MEQPTAQAVVETAIRKLGLEEVRLSASQQLEELGIDSTELAELAANINAELGLHSQRSSLAKLKTVGDVIKYVESLRSTLASPSPSGAEPAVTGR